MKAGGLFEEWAWWQLAARGEAEALDRSMRGLEHIDLAQAARLDHHPVLWLLIQHRCEAVITWLLAQARRSPEHAAGVRTIIVNASGAWGEYGARLTAWARGGPVFEWPHPSPGAPD
jgi:hypothetical protein